MSLLPNLWCRRDAGHSKGLKLRSCGVKGLRQLELRMLDAGVTVSRTAGDLVRYHGKMMIVDREELYVNGFNFTARDLASRSFGLVTRTHKSGVTNW